MTREEFENLIEKSYHQYPDGYDEIYKLSLACQKAVDASWDRHEDEKNVGKRSFDPIEQEGKIYDQSAAQLHSLINEVKKDLGEKSIEQELDQGKDFEQKTEENAQEITIEKTEEQRKQEALEEKKAELRRLLNRNKGQGIDDDFGY